MLSVTKKEWVIEPGDARNSNSYNQPDVSLPILLVH